MSSFIRVKDIDKKLASQLCVDNHYLHRRPPMSFCFGLFCDSDIVGVVTFGTPPSRHLQISVCPVNPSLVIELNRLWVSDDMPRNTESYFIAKALKLLPARIVCSYADTAQGHVGYVYRASNWNYAGYTDMDRKTPRYDYVTEGKHSRDAFRNGYTKKVRRKPKYKYWITTGTKRERRNLAAICGWPCLDWNKVYVDRAIVV
jgi:hypothetical protein